MDRSKSYIGFNLVLLLIAVIGFYYGTRSLRKDQAVKQVSLEKENEFRRDVAVLDSVYKQWVAALDTRDPITIAEKDAVLDKQIALIQKEYTGATAPALLAKKLLRNYQVRVLLNDHLQTRKTAQAGQIEKAGALLTKLKAQNEELKTQNQMVKQVLLGL